MLKLLLLIFLIYCIGHWIYALVIYDWSNFEDDLEQAKKDLF